MENLGGHALGYDIGAFRTIFPRVRPSNRNPGIRPLTTLERKTVIPWNPSLQQLMSSRLSNKLITRKGFVKYFCFIYILNIFCKLLDKTFLRLLLSCFNYPNSYVI